MLTDLQLEVVMNIANGKTISEIADDMHRSQSSVNKVVAAARRRAEARTLPHLVSIVIASGVLYWTEEGRTLDEPEKAGSGGRMYGKAFRD